MANSIHAAASSSANAVGRRGELLRLAVVVTSSLGIMISIPGWLRSLEDIPSPLNYAQETAPLESQSAAPAVDQSTNGAVGDAARYQVLAEFLSKRYRVSGEALERFIRLADSAGQMTKLDPLLILAVMAVESSFNPIAESVTGAKGLMQVVPQYHQDKLRAPHGGELNVLDPETNILVGAKVLREYASRTGEDFAAALRLYGGTGPDPGNPYASRVLSERYRLEQFLRRVQQRTAVDAVASANKT